MYEFMVLPQRKTKIDRPPKLMSINEFTFQDKIVTDRRGTPVKVFEGASHALSKINRIKMKGMPLKDGISSRTGEGHTWGLL